MDLSRKVERVGLALLRWGSKRPVLLLEPPSWTVKYLKPLPPSPMPVELNNVGKAGVWLIRRANPLAYVNATGTAIKVTLP